MLVDSFHELPASGWTYEHTLTDSFTIEKPGHYHAIFCNLRINGDYPYANIHVKLSIQHPDSTTTEHKIPLTLAEKSGKWLGSGLGDAITYQTPILHRKFFNKKGTYTITLAQDMRLENMPNVLSAGIRVEQQEEIF